MSNDRFGGKDRKMNHWRVSKSSKPTWCPLRCTGDHGRYPFPSLNAPSSI